MNINQKMAQIADQCVKCGLCIPHCPTYSLFQTEAESPRGRIAMLGALAKDELTPTAKFNTHIDHCLTCRACEAVCPAGVEYGRLLDSGKALRRDKARESKNTRPQKLLSLFVSSRRFRKTLHWFLWLAYATRINKLGHLFAFGAFKKVFSICARTKKIKRPKSFKHFYYTDKPPKGLVGLHLGCATEIFDNDVHAKLIEQLNTLGFDVHIPKTQGCCGALFLHDGYAEEAKRQMQANIDAFSEQTYVAILSSASACALTLKEYKTVVNEDIADKFSRYVQSSSHFLNAQTTHCATVGEEKQQQGCLSHVPCTEKMLYKLDGQKPPKECAQRNKCCGAAGTYFLQHSHEADELGKALLETLPENSTISSENIGCRLHLNCHPLAKEKNIQFVHPLNG